MPETDLSFLISGVIFGLSGGLTPGPLLTFIIAETMKHGTREGVKISLVPIISDLPIVLLTLYIAARLSDIGLFVGGIALAGGLYLIFLAYESLRFTGSNLNLTTLKPQSLKKGIIINFLNPNPYIFWLTIGAPMVIRGMDFSWLAPVLFICAMYLCLVGSKILVAIMVGKSNLFLKNKVYIYTVRFLGLVLLGFAISFIFKAWQAFSGL